MGIPVVIAENGQGFPVKPVEDNAPVMTVAENGLGAPIVISELGAPFIVEGIVPPIDWDWQAFSITAGDSGDWIGYSNGDIVSPPFNPPVGLIDRQPTAITDLVALFQDVGSGDIVAVFNGLYGEELQSVPLAIGGFALTPNGWSELAGNTWLRFVGLPGDLDDGALYELEFSDAN